MSNRKSRRNRQPNVPAQSAPAPTQAAGGGSGLPIKMPAKSAASTETINADYTHVFGDLRRIGVIAGLLVVGLIVLSFFIK